MTSVEWLIEQLTIRDRFIPDFLEQQAKEMEKQQIIDAYDQDLYGGLSKDRIFNDGNDYYNETYGSKGSDELSKVAENTSFDTSSQTEISDEEIEDAKEYHWSYKNGFVEGAKWYREQLKKKQ